MSRVLVGCSGWSYTDWIGVLYRTKKNWFSEYANIFPTTEINSTFYAYPKENLMRGLARVSPQEFVFSAKIPQLITHVKRLRVSDDVGKDLNRFLYLIEPLRSMDKLGALLIQLPPSFDRQPDVFEEFISILPIDDYEFVVEFRDLSWMTDETWRLLRKFRLGYCIVDEPLLPPTTEVTSNIAYIRWHGRGKQPWYYYEYGEQELSEWKPKVEAVAEKAEKTYAYFNNHYRGYAPLNALQMMKILGIAEPKHHDTLEIVQRNIKEKALPVRQLSLDTRNITVEGMMRSLIEQPRMKRAKQIPDKELQIIRNEEGFIEAKIHNYAVIVNVKESYIRHDCEDWQKRVEAKRFCKHVSKLFLSIPEEQSKQLLSQIINQIELWTFM